MSVLSMMSSQARLSMATTRQSCRQFRQKARRDRLPEGKSGPVVEGEQALPPAGWSVLIRPAVFTAAFTGAAMGGCAVWQYENMRREALRSRVMLGGWDILGRKKAGEFREEVRRWWAGLGEGEKLFWPICGLNVIVWAGWKVPAMQSFMMRWFMGNPASRATCIPLLLSAFSHHSLIHLGCNMMVLHSFMPPAVHLLGKEQFLAVYLSSGVITSLASMVHKVAVGSTAYSLGASGAICCVLGMFGSYVPEAKMQILFLPMITFSAATAIKTMALVDLAGLVLRWRLFDHAAHLSGILCGVGWALWGSGAVWGRREGLVTSWHNFRDKNRRE